jgi:hypothetical protein
MKRFISIFSAAILLCLMFSGCGKTNAAVKQEGTYVADTYELSVPDGWMRNESQANMVFVPKDYPDTASYISIGTTDETQIEELMTYKNSVIANIVSQMTEQLGDEAKPQVKTYEKVQVNSYDCVHVVTAYYNDGFLFEQDQYTFDSSSGSVTVTYVNAVGEDFADAFSESLATVVIK